MTSRRYAAASLCMAPCRGGNLSSLISGQARGVVTVPVTKTTGISLAQFDLDVQIFQALPLYIRHRHRVLKEGQVLFVRDEDLLYEVAFQTAQAFEDFKPIYYYRYLEQISHVGP